MPEFTDEAEPSAVLRRLQQARAHVLAAPALAANWFDQTVRLRLGGAARAMRDPELANHFRRSLGGALGAGASPECAATHPPSPCPWQPPCALDIFFREQMRIGGDGLPKPFICFADREGDDLIASVRIFGFATEWLPAIEQAFVDAMRFRLPWRKLGLSKPCVLDRVIESCDGIAGADMPPGALLDWITPLDAENIDAAQKTGSILTRLHRRLNGLAHWHDSALVPLEADAVAMWEAVASFDDAERLKGLPARSGADRRTFFTDGVCGSVTLSGDVAPFWPLLLLGERSAIGRGAVRGMGRYQLFG